MPRVDGISPKTSKDREKLKWLKGTANQSSPWLSALSTLNQKQLWLNKLSSKYLHMALLPHSRKDSFCGS